MDLELRELDVVALTRDVPAHHLARGQVGTVVMVLSGDAMEVEFVDDHGVAYAQMALPTEYLLRLHYHRMLPA